MMKLRIFVLYFLVLAVFIGLYSDKTYAIDKAIHPKTGYWEGDHSVSFKVTDNGDISDFKMVYMVGTMTCYVEIDKIHTGKDGGFAVKNFMPDENYKFPENIPKEESDKLYRPEAVTRGKDKMVEVQRIIGKFDSVDTVTGNFLILVCKEYHQYLFKDSDEVLHGRKWSAKWKRLK